MARGLLARLFWRMIDALDYFLTLARLRILDALAGPLPETPADHQRQHERERLEKAFPEVHSGERGAVISNRADRVRDR
jgi:hypothetical protein